MRPIVLADISSPTGSWYDVLFLIDTGAEQTYLTLGFASRLGLKGNDEFVTDIRFSKFRETVRVKDRVRVEAELSLKEYSILGRDIHDNFTVLLDRSRNLVALLTADHGYTIADA